MTKASTDDILDIDEMNDENDYITEDDVCKVFDRLFIEMQGVMAALTQEIQKIQMQGQMIPEQQLRQVLRNEFERALQLKQTQIFEDMDMDEDCLEEATWEFLEQEAEYPKVKRSVERFQKLWENISGESVVGKRPGKNGDVDTSAGVAKVTKLLEPTKTIETAEIYFSALTNAMGELVAQYKAKGKNLKSPAVAQELQMEFASVANDAGEKALEEIGVALTQFQKSIEAHSSDPTVQRSLAMLQMKQQQALMSMGIAM